MTPAPRRSERVREGSMLFELVTGFVSELMVDGCVLCIVVCC